jgi:hypothetical protein
MPGTGKYVKKKKGERGFKMKNHIMYNKPKSKKAMDAFIAAQLQTKGSDERETERINN